jgi:hypothetical protein
MEARGTELRIRIEYVGAPDFWFDLLPDSDVVGPGATADMGEGATLTYSDAFMGKGADVLQWVELALQIPNALVSIGLIAHWLITRGPKPDQVRGVTIEREKVEYSEGEIVRVIREKITGP